MISDSLLWLVTGLSIVGTILNVRRVRFCFVLWGLTNMFWVVRNLSIGETQQAILFLVYLGFAVWGWFAWQPRAENTAVPGSSTAQA